MPHLLSKTFHHLCTINFGVVDVRSFFPVSANLDAILTHLLTQFLLVVIRYISSRINKSFGGVFYWVDQVNITVRLMHLQHTGGK